MSDLLSHLSHEATKLACNAHCPFWWLLRAETAHLLGIYKSRKCEFICSIVEAEIKPDGRSVYKVNHFGAPGVKFWWRNSHVCRDHFPQSRSMPNYKFFHPRALRHTFFQKLFKIVVVKAEKILKNGNKKLGIIKVHIFWEGHKILQNLPLSFDCMDR